MRVARRRPPPIVVGTALLALYLLFNEGYHGASPESGVRTEFCREAMRLTNSLLAHQFAATPATHALAAFMCFDAAHLPAPVHASGQRRPLL